jgi:hypothetical protein
MLNATVWLTSETDNASIVVDAFGLRVHVSSSIPPRGSGTWGLPLRLGKLLAHQKGLAGWPIKRISLGHQPNLRSLHYDCGVVLSSCMRPWGVFDFPICLDQRHADARQEAQDANDAMLQSGRLY